MMANKPLRFFLLGVLAVWTIVSIAALGGMYKLWWERERVNYFGKTVEVQRSLVLRNAGSPETLLDVYKTLDMIWPQDITYSATGDQNQLSYLKYLLLPRIPAGSDHYSLDAGGVFSSPVASAALPVEQKHNRPSIFALLGSLFVFAGLTLVLKKLFKRLPFSFPELFGCTLLICMVCVVVSRAVFAGAVPAFYLLTLVGVASWIWLFIRKYFGNTTQSLAILSVDRSRKDHPRSSRAKIWQLIVPAIIALSIHWSLIMSIIVVPDDWDAWAIWAAKAKVLALGHGPLFDVSHFGHADYPLLLPSVWAYSGWLGGGWEEMWSRGWGGVFLLLVVWEIVVIIERVTGRRDLGMLGGALFVSMPMVPLIASWSYAEAPFWLLTTACIGCLLLEGSEGEKTKVFIAALLAAATAYTKNEGVMFAVITCFWMLFVPGTRKPKQILIFVVTFSLCYFPWFYWTHVTLQLGSHAVSGLYLDLENLQRAFSRIPPALEAIEKIWLDVKQWNIVLWLCLCFACLGLFTSEGRKWIVIPAGMLLGYFIIIIFHQAEIYWQVGTAWNRLTLHAIPLLLIGGVIQARELFLSKKE